MNLITAENRELALSMSINQRNPHEPDGPHMGVCYLALTFGTLLSSQGADAHVPRPISWPFFVAVISTLHQVPQQSNAGFFRRFPRPCGPGRSRLVHGELYTPSEGVCRGVPSALSVRARDRAELRKRRSGHAPRPELDAHPWSDGLRRLRDA